MQRIFFCANGQQWSLFQNPWGQIQKLCSKEQLVKMIRAVGRHAIVFHLDRLPGFLASLGDAADVTVNHSVLIYPDSSQSTVKAPSFPSVDGDLAVSLRGGADMSLYTQGFSLVTDMRLYLAESLNNVTIPAPPNAGLPAGAEYLPPVSLFAPEKRFGESATFNHPVQFAGQLHSLKTSSSEAFRPLDLKSGRDDSVNPSMIEADLTVLRSPAELPPVHQMNWLVTIEEVFTGPVSGACFVVADFPWPGPFPSPSPPTECSRSAAGEGIPPHLH